MQVLMLLAVSLKLLGIQQLAVFLEVILCLEDLLLSQDVSVALGNGDILKCLRK